MGHRTGPASSVHPQGWMGPMYRQFGGGNFSTTFDRSDAAVAAIARSGSLDALIALEQIGSRRNFARD